MDYTEDFLQTGEIQMKKILFLPLLRMQSGHHQVAEALMNMFQTAY